MNVKKESIIFDTRVISDTCILPDYKQEPLKQHLA